MKKVIFTRFVTLLITVVTVAPFSFSQFDNVEFLRSAPADGVKLIQAYISPWANAFGAGLNGSWYNSAKPHKLGGFDITFSANVGMVPESAGTFEISSLGLSPALSGSGSAPTVAGPKQDGPQMTYTMEGVELATFNTPPGTEWKYIPVPTLQAGIGLPLGSELKVRFVPRIPIQDGDVMLWGVGLMHSIMQYFPGSDLLPVDVSVFAGYTKLNGNVPLALDPGSPQDYSTWSLASFADQNMEATIDALNISAIASLNLPVISFYGGLGYSKTGTIVQLTGYYPLPVLVEPSAGAPYVEYNDDGVIAGADFPEVNIENFSGLRANAGFRIKLAVLTIHFDYTRSQYNVLSAGLGISFR